MVDVKNIATPPFFKIEEVAKPVFAVVDGEDTHVIGEGKYGLRLTIGLVVKGERRRLTLSGTDVRKISEVFGTNTSEWIGKRLRVYAVPSTTAKSGQRIAVSVADKK